MPAHPPQDMVLRSFLATGLPFRHNQPGMVANDKDVSRPGPRGVQGKVHHILHTLWDPGKIKVKD